MDETVDFYYDYGSPTAYLAWTQLPNICKAHGASLNYRPMLLGGVFKATGNTTPVTIEAKGKWMFEDIARFAERYRVPYRMNPHFIINTLTAMRGAMWAQAEGCLEPYNAALFEATWAHGINTADENELGKVLAGASLDAHAMRDACKAPEIKKALIDATESAVARGVFGAPTMFLGDVMHFGQDRLDWINEQLDSGR